MLPTLRRVYDDRVRGCFAVEAASRRCEDRPTMRDRKASWAEPRSRPAAPVSTPVADPRAREVLRLQRAVGNRAVAALLQRQEADAPLTPAQVKKALAFYKSQPDRYTPEIVKQIQAKVGVAETGIPDEAFAQAVAVWQRDNGDLHPKLWIDGMAGPRTLPRMFPSGLQSGTEPQDFGKEAQTNVIDRWQQLSVDKRIAELIRLVNTHLANAKVPPVAPDPQDTLNSGVFHFPAWTMIVGKQAMAIEQPNLAQAKDFVDTIYHEARHAEQWFRIAQLRCLQRRAQNPKASDDQIARGVATELGIPNNIADEAVKPPPFALGSMDALIAQGWFDSVYGSGSTRRVQILTELDKAEKALEAAKKKQKEHPSPANQLAVERAQERLNRAIAGHATLPEEDDAFVAGERSQPGVVRGAPPKPAPAPGGGGPPGGAGAPAPAPAAPAGVGALPVPPTKLAGLQAALEDLVGARGS